MDEEEDEIQEPSFKIHQRAVENDPNRCDGTTGQGPCPYVRVPGANYCAMHGGSSAITRAKLESKRKYLAAQWRAQIDHFADDPDLKRLNEEIGILRMVLSKTLDRCHSDNDLLLRSSSIGELVDKIGRMVATCHTIDQKIGVMLDRAQLADFGAFVIGLVSEFVTDDAQLDRFNERLMAKIVTIGTPDDKGLQILKQLTG